MPISVDYGPIGLAMGLATQGGQNLAAQTNNQNDMSLLGYAQRAQQMNNTQRATEIQEALSGRGLDLEEQRNQAQNALAQAQLAATTGYHTASLQGINQYRQGRNDIGQQNADTAQDRAGNQADYNSGRLDVSQQRADTANQNMGNLDAYHQALAAAAQQNAGTRQQGMENQNQNAGDANDINQQNADTRQLQGEYNSLNSYAANHERNFGDPNDPQYVAVKARMAAIMQQMSGRQMGGSSLPAPQVNAARLPPQAAQQQQAPQQQGGSSPANPVAIQDDRDFASLPSGTYFTGPDGVLRQKP